MVHVDPALLRRYPIIGVLIGGAAAVFLASLIQSGWAEVRALVVQKTPEPVSLQEATALRGIRWITVSDVQWHCDQSVTIERPPGLERWVRGPIETTEVPITGASGGVLVASFDGAVACSERAGAPVTGVVGSTEIFTSRGAHRRWGRGEKHVAILAVGASPRYALTMLGSLAAIALGGFAFAAYYFILMVRLRDRHMPPRPSAEPIQPS